jgi:hypothetical protein
MRSTYGFAKATAFTLLALTLGLRGLWAGTPRASWADALWTFAVVVSWIAAALCVIRGAPVLIEAPALLRDLDAKVAQQSMEQ